MDPQQRETAKVFDSYKDSYSSAVDQAIAFTGLTTDFFTKVKADYILDIARDRLAGRTLSVLDVGCGVGNYHRLLAPTFGRLCGVDVSEACVETARRRNPSVSYETYDGERLPYADASFDLAFTICVLHHVPPQLGANFMREMRRVLRPGGMALVFEHNPRNKLTMRAVNKCPFDEDAVPLKHEETKALMQAAGFQAVKSRFILSVPAKGAFLRRVDRVFARLPLGAQYYASGIK
jgi:ubiquinone/menaquinone biosynthesis C-methylase UbiE